jgi:hypothetical protein
MPVTDHFRGKPKARKETWDRWLAGARGKPDERR